MKMPEERERHLLPPPANLTPIPGASTSTNAPLNASPNNAPGSSVNTSVPHPPVPSQIAQGGFDFSASHQPVSAPPQHQHLTQHVQQHPQQQSHLPPPTPSAQPFVVYHHHHSPAAHNQGHPVYRYTNSPFAGPNPPLAPVAANYSQYGYQTPQPVPMYQQMGPLPQQPQHAYHQLPHQQSHLAAQDHYDARRFPPPEMRKHVHKGVKSPSSSLTSEEQELKKKRKRLSISCTTCRKRKIKCDRQRPICGACQRNNVPVHLCIYDDSPWVSSLVKEQTLQTEIESLFEQRQKLKEVISEKDSEIIKLKQKFEVKLDELKNDAYMRKAISITSLMNSDEEENESETFNHKRRLNLKKLSTFSDSAFNGLLTFRNFIKLTPSMSATFQVAQPLQNIVNEYPAYNLQNFVQDLPPFKVFEAKFQYLFDINYDPSFQFMSIVEDSTSIQSMFYKNFNRRHKLNPAQNDELEICFCLLILQFSIMFNEDEDFYHDGRIFSLCNSILLKHLSKHNLHLNLLKNLLLFNNLSNVIGLNPQDTNLSILTHISQCINSTGFGSSHIRSTDKDLWLAILYQDYFVCLQGAMPLQVTNHPQFEFDEDNFDDVCLRAIVLLRQVYMKATAGQHQDEESFEAHHFETSILNFYDNHIIKFDPKFCSNFHVRTSKSGLNKDKRLILTFLFLDVLIGLKFLEFLTTGEYQRLVQYFVVALRYMSWIFDQILTEESCSKNRVLQITLAPALKLSILKCLVALVNLQETKPKLQKPEDDPSTPEGAPKSLWETPLPELEKQVMTNRKNTNITTRLEYDLFLNSLNKIKSDVSAIDLFQKDLTWMTDFNNILHRCLSAAH